LNFVNSTLPLFHDAITKAEVQELTAVESWMTVSHLNDKLNARKEENFIPVSVMELLSSLEDGSYSKNQFLNVSHDFYSTALQYLYAWGVQFDDIHHAECILLKTVPQRMKIEETIHFFSAKADVIVIDEDTLFDEISSLKAFVTKKKIKEWDKDNARTCARWSEVFLHFPEKMVPYLQLQRLVELSLCLPGSNASVERVFSVMNMIWTSQQSRLCL
jgi:hypothetical protein